MENDKIFSNDSDFHFGIQIFPPISIDFSLIRTSNVDSSYIFR